jgi:hypothetical protein
MKSDALLASGPIHDNHPGIPHNVDDDADSPAIDLSHIIADFETLHDLALLMLNSRKATGSSGFDVAGAARGRT